MSLVSKSEAKRLPHPTSSTFHITDFPYHDERIQTNTTITQRTHMTHSRIHRFFNLLCRILSQEPSQNRQITFVVIRASSCHCRNPVECPKNGCATKWDRIKIQVLDFTDLRLFLFFQAVFIWFIIIFFKSSGMASMIIGHMTHREYDSRMFQPV